MVLVEHGGWFSDIPSMSNPQTYILRIDIATPICLLFFFLPFHSFIHPIPFWNYKPFLVPCVSFLALRVLWHLGI